MHAVLGNIELYSFIIIFKASVILFCFVKQNLMFGVYL